MWFLFLPILFIRVILEKLGLLKRTELRNEEERAAVADKQFRMKKGIVNVILLFLERVEYQYIMKGKRQLFGASVVMVLEKQ